MSLPGEPDLAWLLQSAFGWVLAAVWGALWGSFATVCIHRIPRGESLVQPGSHCPGCGRPVAWYHNVPVLGWLLLGGRCAGCRARISLRYPLVELFAAGLSLLLWARFVAVTGLGPVEAARPLPVALLRFLIYFFFVETLLILSAIDIEHLLLPDRITYVAIPGFFLLGRLLYALGGGGAGHASAFVGMAAGYLILEAIAYGYLFLTGRDGLGGGDSKLMGLIGGLLGWQALPFTLLVGSLSGLLIGAPLALVLGQRRAEGGQLRHTPVVFGPFLSFGALAYLLLLVGRDIDSVLLRVLGPLLGETV